MSAADVANAAEIARLRAALEQIIEAIEPLVPGDAYWQPIYKIARAALEPKP